MENKALVMDFLAWFADGPRAYEDVMEAWRTSCPRLTIWEDAVDAGLISRTWTETSGSMIALSSRGAAFLESARVSQAPGV